jgi:hypothetical protein
MALRVCASFAAAPGGVVRVLRRTLIPGSVLAYEAHPSSQSVATFTARESTDSTVVFANPTHDYPQEIGYQRVGADSLLAWIDGPLKGKPRRVEFRYARVKCSGP